MDLWFSWRTALLVVFVILCVLGHVRVTKLQISAGLWDFGEGFAQKVADSRREDFHSRFDEELLQARLQMMKKAAAVMTHLTIVYGIGATGKFFYETDISSFFQACVGWLSYHMLAVCHDVVKTADQFEKFHQICIVLHVFLTVGAAFEEDLARFDLAEKLCTIGVISTSMTTIDTKATLPLFFCQSATLIYSRLNLIGFSNISPYIVCACIIPQVVVAGVIIICVDNIRSNIAAKILSGDASSLMLGFRHILRGVCDGDLILDRRTMTIVDDASCLSRLLKSNRNYSNSNFLDLFLDSPSRQRFSEFLAEAAAGGEALHPTVPRGLRVSLQGARGAVSMDVFYTALPRPLVSSRDYCLLAMKEDPEQLTAIPEASEDSVPRIAGPLPRARSRSSVLSELVVAYQDLQEVALLVSDATGFLDIEEVHLSFQRKSAVSNIESGMPTLRKFIRPSDWDRIENMFAIVNGLPPADQQQRCYFQRPTLFRVPGESRSYLCARSTSLCLADRVVVPGRPIHYWMHLTQFDDSQIQRPREQELEGIEEE